MKIQNDNQVVTNNFLQTTQNLTSFFQKHGVQMLKFHFITMLDLPDRIAMRGTCKTIKNYIPKPRYEYFKPGNKRKCKQRARMEKTIGAVEVRDPHTTIFIPYQLKSNVKNIYVTATAFAALKINGSVITWGCPDWGGDSTDVMPYLQSGVNIIASTRRSFAALKANGRVVTWGSPNSGGDFSNVCPELDSDVKSIACSDCKIAVLKQNGRVLIKGRSIGGGDYSRVSSQLQSGVQQIFSNTKAFAALKPNGSVITWGNRICGGNSTSVSFDLQSNVKTIASTCQAFAALKTNGSVVTWGLAEVGGNSGEVSDYLRDGVLQIDSFDKNMRFRATKIDGTVVCWPKFLFGIGLSETKQTQ